MEYIKGKTIEEVLFAANMFFMCQDAYRNGEDIPKGVFMLNESNVTVKDKLQVLDMVSKYEDFKPEGEEQIRIKHENAIKELYESNGVGDTDKCKFAFWEKQHPNGYSISHNPDMQTAIGIFEFTYLVELYPCDFSLH